MLYLGVVLLFAHLPTDHISLTTDLIVSLREPKVSNYTTYEENWRPLSFHSGII